MANTLKFGNGQWATKVGSTLAYNDEGGNFKPLPFNFTRSTGGTRVNKDGLIEVVTNNKPRIDFLNDSNGALLLEPSRTNLITYSEQFDNAAWTKTNATVTANYAISPDGYTNADKFIPNTINSIHSINQTGFASNAYTFSVFAKADGETTFSMWLLNNTVRALFDLSNGTIILSTVTSSKIEDYGNGWYRCSVYSSTAGTTAAIYSRTGGVFIGNDSDGILLYGAQLEQGSYPTSYIPTQGATATRVAETCIDAGNSQIFNDSEGVLFAEISALVDDNTVRMIQISDGTNGNRVIIYYKNGGTINGALASGGSTAVDIPFSATFTNTNKVAIRYKLNDVSLWINGVKVGEDLSANSPIGLDRLSFNQDGGANYFYGNTKDLRVYNTALTDQELINLTTI
jgi:hypothetical protein